MELQHIKYYSLIFLLFNLVHSGMSQSRQELESRKNQIGNEIEYTNNLLNENKRIVIESQNNLVLINKRINLRDELIQNINLEIDLLEQKIIDNQIVINALENDIADLKDEYGKMIYFSYRNRNRYTQIAFIFSSSDFNQAFRRIKYLQQYSEYRKRQIRIINSTEKILNEKLVDLEVIISNKKNLAYSKQSEVEKLTKEKENQAIAIKKLKINEKKLRLQLVQQIETAGKIKKEIEDLIAEETRKAAEKLKMSKVKDNGNSKIYQLTPDERLLSNQFSQNKSRLPWPTEHGIITGTFGEHPHPILKGVIIRNDGIDISTTEGAIVRAIFEGEVSRVFVIPGANKCIIIRHGDFLTVYSNMKEIYVKPGDKVKLKQSIGVVYTDKNDGNRSCVKFQLWKESTKLDPSLWLAQSR